MLGPCSDSGPSAIGPPPVPAPGALGSIVNDCFAAALKTGEVVPSENWFARKVTLTRPGWKSSVAFAVFLSFRK